MFLHRTNQTHKFTGANTVKIFRLANKETESRPEFLNTGLQVWDPVGKRAVRKLVAISVNKQKAKQFEVHNPRTVGLRGPIILKCQTDEFFKLFKLRQKKDSKHDFYV